MPKTRVWVLALFGLLSFCGSTAFGQFSGDILVQVSDASGAAVPKASVTVRSATGSVRNAQTGTDGQARLSQLSVGDYVVRAENPSFTATETQVRVTSGTTSTVPLTLQVRQSRQQVVVLEAPPVVNTVNSQLQTSTEATQITSLPIVGAGGPLVLAASTPGVTPVTPNNPFLGLGSFNSNGGRGRGNNITVDGAQATDVSTTGAAGLGTVPVDAVLEFNIITNNFQAEYGRNSSAQVQLFTKGGTNEFHGDLFEFFRNDKLNARDYFDRTGQPAPQKNNDFGAVAGLPILQNKLFVYGTYEEQKVRGAGGTRIAQVPTPAQVAAATDPTALALLRQEAVPTSATGTVSVAAPSTTNFYAGSMRVDYNITPRDVFYARVGVSDTQAQSPGLTFISSNLANNGASSTNRPYNATLSETHTFSPSVVNQLIVAYGRSAPNFPPLASFLGPEIDFNDGTSTFGPSNILPQGRIQNTFNEYESLSWNRGKHQFKFGAQFERVQANSFFDANIHGTYTFLTLQDFLSGNPFTYTQRFGNSVRGNRLFNQSYYAQDDYKVSRYLTLNLGVRLEVAGPVKEVNNIISNLNLNRQGALGAAGTGPLGTFDFGKNANYFQRNYNWAPALGFAWNPEGGKWVFRGGYRIAYDFIFLNPITNGRFLPPYMYNLSVPNGGFTGGNTFASLAAGTSTFQQQGRALIGTFGTNITDFGGVNPIDQDLRNPQVQQWSFTVERELFAGLVAHVSYVGTKGNYLQRSRPINLIAPGQFTPPTTLAQQRAQQASGLYSRLNSALNAGPSGRSNRIDPRFNGVTLVESSANSNYHGLQVSVSKRVTDWYGFSADYTWSKSIDDSSDVLGVLANDTPAQQDPTSNRNNRAVSEFDVPHRFTLRHDFQPGWFKNSSSGLVRAVLSGWELHGIFQAQSGFPLNFFAGAQAGLSDALLLGGNGQQRPNVNGQINLHLLADPGSTVKPNQLTNSNLSQPLVGQFGNLGRNVFRENPLLQSDMTLAKRFAITERVGLLFQGQVFNLFNNTTFSSPGVNLSRTSTFGYYQSTDTNSRNVTLTARLVW